MHIYFNIIGSPSRHLYTVLEELKKQSAVTKFEVFESRHEVKFEPFNAQSIFKIGVLLGQVTGIQETKSNGMCHEYW